MAFHDTINTGVTPNDGQGDGLRTNIRKLHDNTKDNKQRLDDFNENTPEVINVRGITVLRPSDAYLSASGNNTGALKITLPNGFTNTMIRLEGFVYLYNGQGFKFFIKGSLPPSDSWEATGVTILSSFQTNYTVRFGYDGQKCVIYIGELNSSWLFPQVFIKTASFYRRNIHSSLWLTGWNISIENSSFQNITSTETTTLPVAQI